MTQTTEDTNREFIAMLTQFMDLLRKDCGVYLKPAFEAWMKYRAAEEATAEADDSNESTPEDITTREEEQSAAFGGWIEAMFAGIAVADAATNKP